MRRERVLITCVNLTWLLLLLRLENPRARAAEADNAYSMGCAGLQCASGTRCIKRRFWCKSPPCPGMLYCSKSRQESLKGPETCDTVRCSEGHVCIIRVRGCHWGEKCRQQIARCVSEEDYYEGPASCVGFECPPGERCLLREPYCIRPPCKLIRSCVKEKDVQIWLDKCKELDCLSEYECFLRKPDEDCLDLSCIHTPDCTLTTEDELTNEYCRGWICPRAQKCAVRIVGSCKGFNCTIERYCRSRLGVIRDDTLASDKVAGQQSSTGRTLVQVETKPVRQEMERRAMNDESTSYPITWKRVTSAATSTREQPDYATSRKHRTETPMIYQRLTTKSNLITEPPELSSKQPSSTLSHSRYRPNHDESSTAVRADGNGRKIADDVHTATSAFSSRSWNSSSPGTSLADGEVKPSASDDTKGPEIPRIHIETDGTLPLSVVLEGIDVVGQGYPIWIENELHRAATAAAAEADDENDDGGRYYALQEPYRILLPPYKPAIVVQDATGEQPPLFFAFNHRLGDATLASLHEVTSRGGTESSESNDGPLVNDHKITADDSSVHFFATTGNLEADYFAGSPGNHASSFPAIESTDIAVPNIRDKESDGYYDRGATPTRLTERRRAEESRGDRASETRVKSLATRDPPWNSMERSDYGSSRRQRNEEQRRSPVNYPYSAITVRGVNQSAGYREFPLEMPKSKEEINQAPKSHSN